MADPDRLVPGVIVRVGWIMDTPPWVGIIRKIFLPGLNTDSTIAHCSVQSWPNTGEIIASVYVHRLEIIYDR